MPSVRQFLLGILLLAAASAAGAASPEALPQLTLAATSRVYITLVPRTADDDFGPRWLEGDATQPSLNLALRTARRNRLEFSLSQRDVLAQGDRLQLRLASDAHVVAQLLSGGAFSELDDSWIAVLGLASRVRLSYTNGPVEFSVSAKRKFGEGAVKAQLTIGTRF
jgi:hypothetical protein